MESWSWEAKWGRVGELSRELLWTPVVGVTTTSQWKHHQCPTKMPPHRLELLGDPVVYITTPCRRVTVWPRARNGNCFQESPFSTFYLHIYSSDKYFLSFSLGQGTLWRVGIVRGTESPSTHSSRGEMVAELVRSYSWVVTWEGSNRRWEIEDGGS